MVDDMVSPPQLQRGEPEQHAGDFPGFGDHQVQADVDHPGMLCIPLPAARHLIAPRQGFRVVEAICSASASICV